MRILAYPAFAQAHSNPLNALLYGRLAASADILEFELRRSLPPAIDVLHVHWPDLLMADASLAKSVLRCLLFLYRLHQCKGRGIKIVWTVHNLAPHDRANGFLRALFWPGFLDRLDGVVFLSRSSRTAALAAMPALAKLPYRVIPRGNFKPILGELPSRSAARERLDLATDHVVLLNFGQIRPYKNVPALLREFTALAHVNACLIVAGRVAPGSGLAAEIAALAEGRPAIRLDLRFIPDETLAVYLAAADLIVLPYRDILNSAGCLMALSAARPVLCPRLGSIAEIAAAVGPGWVHTYEGTFSAAHLAAAMAAPPPAGREPDLSGCDWSVIARRTLEFFASVAGR